MIERTFGCSIVSIAWRKLGIDGSYMLLHCEREHHAGRRAAARDRRVNILAKGIVNGKEKVLERMEASYILSWYSQLRSDWDTPD